VAAQIGWRVAQAFCFYLAADTPNFSQKTVMALKRAHDNTALWGNVATVRLRSGVKLKTGSPQRLPACIRHSRG